MSDFDDLTDEEPRPRRSAGEGVPASSSRAARSSSRRDGADFDDDWDDDWDDDDDHGPGSGRRDLTLILGIVAAVAIIALVVVLSTKDDKDDSAAPGPAGQPPAGETTLPNKNWQGPVGEAVGENATEVKGRVGSGPGLYIWTDFNGWHLRNTTDRTLTVTVAAETVRVKDQSGSASGDTETSAVVEVAPGDAETGVDIDLGGSTEATFTVKDGEADLPAAEIKLGGGSGQATENPVTFTKA